jgi:predicted RNA-binding Zn ribbon-like protein
MESADNPFAGKELVGGRICLDFANTLGQHHPEPLSEWLHAYEDLVWWALRAGILPESEAPALLERARKYPQAAAEVFRRAIELREAVFRIFSAAAARRDPERADLDVLNGELARAMPHARIAPVSSGCSCDWAWEENGALDRVLWPVARSAAEALTSEDVGRIGECAGDECQWLYLDTSRNHSRRWCVMSDCGNRAKAKRHYRRSKAGAGEGVTTT